MQGSQKVLKLLFLLSTKLFEPWFFITANFKQISNFSSVPGNSRFPASERALSLNKRQIY